MRQLWVVSFLALSAGLAHAGSANRDRHMDGYLAIWADDANVTPPMVERLYARRVVYYGKTMSAAAVYRDKLAFIRRWQHRSYGVVPDTVTNDCGPGAARCRVTAVLRWRRADAAGRHGASGTNTLTLDLVRENGALKIARESGVPVR